MKALFTSTAGAGHMMPLVPMVRAAEQAGFTTLLAAPAESEATARAAGLPFASLTGSPDHAERRAVLEGSFELTPEEASHRVGKEIFGRLNTRDTLSDMQALLADFQPDIVVGEGAECSGGLVAEASGLPHVRVHPGLSTIEFFDRALADGLREHRRSLGLDPDASEAALRNAPQVGYFPRELEFDTPDAPEVLRIRDPRYSVADDAPEPDLVYLTLGSEAAATEFFVDVMQSAIDGLAQAGVRAVVALGHRGDPAAFRVPEGIELHHWVDQADVLARAALVVCHGGAGSVLAALTAGRPLVVLPLFADQPMNAERVAAAGAGLTVAPGPDLAERIAAAVQDIRAGGMPGSARVRTAIAGLPGPEAAIDLLTRLVRARSAV